MNLPPAFQFSQSNLQDYVDCRRRFQLRYLMKVAWPAIESQPVQESERWMRQGASFHRILQQVFTGIPLELISAQAMDTDLASWWFNFQTRAPGLLNFDLSDLPQPWLLPEISLAATLGEFRLFAKFDLIVNRLPEKVIIVDWKTSRRATRRDKQAARIQTRLYPYLLVQAGRRWNDRQAVEPDQVEMIYWYANEPEKVQRFDYDAHQFQNDQAFFTALTQEIAGLPEDAFNLTPQEEHCKYCIYRSLCDRGVLAGRLDMGDYDPQVAGEVDFLLDFDQVSEIEF